MSLQFIPLYGRDLSAYQWLQISDIQSISVILRRKMSQTFSSLIHMKVSVFKNTCLRNLSAVVIFSMKSPKTVLIYFYSSLKIPIF